jgi:hypothetical protein
VELAVDRADVDPRCRADRRPVFAVQIGADDADLGHPVHVAERYAVLDLERL